ncbi:MAG: CHAP domain-containing protein [Eubacteriales bacterium]|nr:CHAP domain-containing protein [Eubacteriales bacterium]
MRKTLKKMIACSLATTMILCSSVGNSVSRAATNNPCGTYRVYTNVDMAVHYALAVRGESYKDLKDEFGLPDGHWCAGFVSKLYDDEDANHAYVSKIERDAERDNLLKKKESKPAVGDLVLYEETVPGGPEDGSDHVGIVVGVNGDKIQTVEGNYFYVDGNISKELYRQKSNSHDPKKRIVGLVPYNNVRYSMISGYVSPVIKKEVNYLVGDLNGDNKINISDVIIMKSVMNEMMFEPRFKTTWGNYDLKECYTRADIDNDGYVKQDDLTLLMRYMVNKK